MEKNIGIMDRNLRYVGAVVMLVLGFYIHWAFYILAFIFAATAYKRECLPYHWLGINTNKNSKKSKKKKK